MRFVDTACVFCIEICVRVGSGAEFSLLCSRLYCYTHVITHYIDSFLVPNKTKIPTPDPLSHPYSARPSPRPPHSSYPLSANPRALYYGTPARGTIGVHHPREIVRIERDWDTGGEVCQFYGTWVMELEGRVSLLGKEGGLRC